MKLPTPERMEELKNLVTSCHNCNGTNVDPDMEDGEVCPSCYLDHELLGYVEAYREANDALIESNVRTATERNELQAELKKLKDALKDAIRALGL